MKNLFKTVAIAVIALFAVTVVGQTAVKFVSSYARTDAGVRKATADTMTVPDTTYICFQPVNYKHDLTFELTNTKISGTVAGTAVLLASNDSTLDRVKWETITGVTSECSTCKGASMTLSDGTVTGRWIAPRSKFQYYRIRCVLTGTATCTPTGKLYYGY